MESLIPNDAIGENNNDNKRISEIPSCLIGFLNLWYSLV